MLVVGLTLMVIGFIGSCSPATPVRTVTEVPATQYVVEYVEGSRDIGQAVAELAPCTMSVLEGLRLPAEEALTTSQMGRVTSALARQSGYQVYAGTKLTDEEFYAVWVGVSCPAE